MVNLILINNGNCTDTASLMVCVYPDNKIFVPNSFTPNLDHCNDEFFCKRSRVFINLTSKYIKVGEIWYLNLMKLYLPIVMLMETYVIYNKQELYTYYKMGTWDGLLENGAEAPMGVYAFVIEYKQLADSPVEKIVGTVTLIR